MDTSQIKQACTKDAIQSMPSGLKSEMRSVHQLIPVLDIRALPASRSSALQTINDGGHGADHFRVFTVALITPSPSWIPTDLPPPPPIFLLISVAHLVDN